MEQGAPLELTKIKEIVAEIKGFPAKMDSTEQAKNARHLLKKYALLSEKIERNVVIGDAHQKGLAKIRTEEFKTIRRTLKEKANAILHPKINIKKPAPQKASKAADVSMEKETKSKKIVKKASPKPKKAAAPK